MPQMEVYGCNEEDQEAGKCDLEPLASSTKGHACYKTVK
jgi:hypothetical protein